jgi:hypothetical protein
MWLFALHHGRLRIARKCAVALFLSGCLCHFVALPTSSLCLSSQKRMALELFYPATERLARPHNYRSRRWHLLVSKMVPHFCFSCDRPTIDLASAAILFFFFFAQPPYETRRLYIGGSKSTKHKAQTTTPPAERQVASTAPSLIQDSI